jgi:hypothetical protein
MGVLMGVAVGWFVGAKSGSQSLSNVKKAVTSMASSGDVTKVLNGAMASAIPMAGQLLRSGRGALEGLKRA